MRRQFYSWTSAVTLAAMGAWATTGMAQEIPGVTDGGVQDTVQDTTDRAPAAPQQPETPALPQERDVPDPAQAPFEQQDLTDGAIDQAGETVDSAEQATDRATDAADEATGRATDAADQATDRATDQADEALDRTQQGAQQATDEARRGAQDAAEDTQQAFEDLDAETQTQMRAEAEFTDDAEAAVSSDLGWQLEASEDGEGMVISNLQGEQSLAAQAGLRQGDRIVSIDGRRFDSHRGYNEYLWRNGHGRIPIVIFRDGNRQTVYWDRYPKRWNNYFYGPGHAHGRQGGYAQQGPQAGLGVLVVASNLPEGGVFVKGVHQNSPAERAGVQPGDVIVAMNGRTYDSASQFVDAIRRMDPNAQVRLEILREGGQATSLTAELSTRNQALEGQYTQPQLASRDNGRQTVLRPQIDGQGRQQAQDVDSQQRIEELEQQVRQLQQQLEDMRNNENR